MHSKILNLKSKIIAVALLALMMGCEKCENVEVSNTNIQWPMGEIATRIEKTGENEVAELWRVEVTRPLKGLTRYEAGVRRDNGEVFAVRASGEFGDFLEARAAMARVKMQLELTMGQGMEAVETDHFVYRGQDRVADLKAEISPRGHPRVVLFVGVRD